MLKHKTDCSPPAPPLPPQIFRPALHKADPRLAAPFFVVFMFLGVWLLMGLLLGVIVEQFRCGTGTANWRGGPAPAPAPARRQRLRLPAPQGPLA